MYSHNIYTTSDVKEQMNTCESGVQFCFSLRHALLSGIALQTESQNWTSETAVPAPAE